MELLTVIKSTIIKWANLRYGFGRGTTIDHSLLLYRLPSKTFSESTVNSPPQEIGKKLSGQKSYPNFLATSFSNFPLEFCTKPLCGTLFAFYSKKLYSQVLRTCYIGSGHLFVHKISCMSFSHLNGKIFA